MTFEKLMKDLTDSMKQQNRVKKAVIADIVTCTKNMAIEKKCKDNITEEIVDAAILKCKKPAKNRLIHVQQIVQIYLIFIKKI